MYTSLNRRPTITEHPQTNSIHDVRTQRFRIQFEGFSDSEYERCVSVAINTNWFIFELLLKSFKYKLLVHLRYTLNLYFICSPSKMKIYALKILKYQYYHYVLTLKPFSCRLSKSDVILNQVLLIRANDQTKSHDFGGRVCSFLSIYMQNNNKMNIFACIYASANSRVQLLYTEYKRFLEKFLYFINKNILKKIQIET